MVSWVNLIESLLIDKEVSIDWNDSNNWSMVENLLLNGLELLRNAIIINFVFLAVGSLGLAFFYGSGLIIESNT